jgi:hypothetical protein
MSVQVCGVSGSGVLDWGWTGVQVQVQLAMRLSEGSLYNHTGAATRRAACLGRRQMKEVSEVGSWELQLARLECK